MNANIKKIVTMGLFILNIIGYGASEKKEIKFWMKGSGKDPGIETVINNFNSSQSDVKVVYQTYGENFANVVNLALSSGDGPDIFESDQFSVPTLAKQGLLEPLDSIMTEEIKKNFYPAGLNRKDYSYKGQTYSIPTRVTSFRLIYNKDLFKAAGLDPNKPPKTMEEMREYAKKITEIGKGKIYGSALHLGSSNVWWRILDPVVVASGLNGQMSFDFEQGKFNFNKDREVLDSYINIGKDGSFLPGYETLSVDQVRANFAQGNIGMYIDGNWTSALYATQIKTDINWTSAPVPVISTYNKGLATLGVDYAIPKTSKNIEEAKKFLKYYIENLEIQQKYKPEPRIFTAANDISKLPIKELNLKGYEVNFDFKDLAPFPIEPYKQLSIKGDNRDKVYTRIFLKALAGENIDVDKEMNVLDKRYNDALSVALKKGDLKLEDIKIENFEINKR